MRGSEGTRARTAWRLASALGGVVAAAACFSFAFGLLGGATHAATPSHIAPVAEAAHRPHLPPLVPPRPPVLPRASVKFMADTIRTSATKSPTAERIASAAPSGSAVLYGHSAVSRSTRASTLLRTESRASRTRGQPELG